MERTEQTTEFVQRAFQWLAFFLVIVGIRLSLVAHFGSALPIIDQWDAEAATLFKPWIDGTLRDDAPLLVNGHAVAIWLRGANELCGELTAETVGRALLLLSEPGQRTLHAYGRHRHACSRESGSAYWRVHAAVRRTH